MSGEAITTIPTQHRGARTRTTDTDTPAARGSGVPRPATPDRLRNRAAQGAMTRNRRVDALGGWLEHARALLSQATHVLDGAAPDPVELHIAVDGALDVTTALAELVETLIRQTPASLPGHADPRLRDELQAELRALHGCLLTGPLLVTPTRHELADLNDRERQP